MDQWIGRSMDRSLSGRVEILDESAWGRGISVSPGNEFPVENMAATAKLLKLWFSLFFLVCLTPRSSLVKVNKETK